MSSTIRSPWLIHYDASSCNGCDIEVLACLTPLFDVERFGIINTGNPKHADIFLVTGSVNERNIGVVQQIYSQMLEPKVVIACGVCACSGGIFRDCYNTLGGIDAAIPVDVYAPGCAVRPEAIIDAVVTGLGVLEDRRKALAAGTLQPVALPRSVTAADKLVGGETVRAAAAASTREALEVLAACESPAATGGEALESPASHGGEALEACQSRESPTATGTQEA
ncbi:MAG: NADH-quinone oxidoreductase subunit NuoB [Coriobacteriales bacterium]|jgi:ech hydrogenase subunit C|nr:NADH-quinone oxidoreductase subunit NuoB [Coriobacteriales bacterium]